MNHEDTQTPLTVAGGDNRKQHLLNSWSARITMQNFCHSRLLYLITNSRITGVSTALRAGGCGAVGPRGRGAVAVSLTSHLPHSPFSRGEGPEISGLLRWPQPIRLRNTLQNSTMVFEEGAILRAYTNSAVFELLIQKDSRDRRKPTHTSAQEKRAIVLKFPTSPNYSTNKEIHKM